MSEGDIRRYTLAQIREMREREGSLTDWARLEAMTDEEVEAAIADAPDSDAGPVDETVSADLINGKSAISIRLDTEILDWFRASGPGYQTRIDAALRRHVRAAKRRRKAG